MIPLMKSPSFAAPRHFAEHPADALALLMAALSLDLTGLLMIGVNYRDSSYAPHRRAAEVILAEEEDHESFASGQLREATERFGIERVNTGLREWLPRAVNFFGPPGSGFTFDCIRYGLKACDNGELAEMYLTMLERRIDQAGLTMPHLILHLSAHARLIWTWTRLKHPRTIRGSRCTAAHAGCHTECGANARDLSKR